MWPVALFTCGCFSSIILLVIKNITHKFNEKHGINEKFIY